MLDTQYRMPAVIGTAISDLFYGGSLKNGAGTDSKEPVLFEGNLTFINFDGDKNYCEKKDKYNKQITNLTEAYAAVSLVMNIRAKDPSCRIAVITPYKGQKRLISNTFVNSGIHYQIENIFVDTVDSFQGSEADVVVFLHDQSSTADVVLQGYKKTKCSIIQSEKRTYNPRTDGILL